MKINDLHEGIWDALKTGARDWAISRGLGGQERQIQQKMAQYAQTRQAAASADARAKQAAVDQKDQNNINAMLNDLPKKIYQGITSKLIKEPGMGPVYESYDYDTNFTRLMENKKLLTEQYEGIDFIRQSIQSLWPTVAINKQVQTVLDTQIKGLWQEFGAAYRQDPSKPPVWSDNAKQFINNIAQIIMQARELTQQQSGETDVPEPAGDVPPFGKDNPNYTAQYRFQGKKWQQAQKNLEPNDPATPWVDVSDPKKIQLLNKVAAGI